MKRKHKGSSYDLEGLNYPIDNQDIKQRNTIGNQVDFKSAK